MVLHVKASLAAVACAPSRPLAACRPGSSHHRAQWDPASGTPAVVGPAALRSCQQAGKALRPAAAAAAAGADGGSPSQDGQGAQGEAVTAADAEFMRRALGLARRAEGQTHPNPAVGCVIVDPASRRVVGEGYHPRAGLPHAEVYALRAAGAAARGATAYVTLEPCNHYGRTPPCSRALVAAGVGRVVVGCTDPNPLVGGQGIATLRQAGIPVAVGCEEVACFQLNAEFMARMQAQAAEEATTAAAAAAAAAAGAAAAADAATAAAAVGSSTAAA